MADLAPEVVKRLACGRDALEVSLFDLCFLAGKVFGGASGPGVPYQPITMRGQRFILAQLRLQQLNQSSKAILNLFHR